jgi:Zn ribbon nucleic-acid-binding protein
MLFFCTLHLFLSSTRLCAMGVFIAGVSCNQMVRRADSVNWDATQIYSLNVRDCVDCPASEEVELSKTTVEKYARQ